jgi:CHAT domain-containing protein
VELFGHDHSSVARVYGHIASAYWGLMRFDSVIHYANLSLDILWTPHQDFSKIPTTNIWSLAMDLKSRSLLKIANWSDAGSISEALETLLTADQYHGYLKSRNENPADIGLLGDVIHDTHELIIPIYAAIAETGPEGLAEAFYFSEKNKGYALLETVRNTQIPELEAHVEKIKSVQSKIDFYDLKIFEAEKGEQPNEEIINDWKSILFDLKRQLLLLKTDDMPDVYRDFKDADLNTVYISIQDVQQQLLKSGEALLEYFVGDSAIFVFVVRPDTFALIKIPQDFALDSLVTQLRHGIYGFYRANRIPALYAQTAQQYTEAATILYDKLIAPVQPLLPKRLYIVPDGALGYVPFEALLLRADARADRFNKHHYFGQDHIISYAYSATLLREMRAKKHRKEPQGKVLAMAPFFRGDVHLLSEAVASGEALFALRSDTLSALPDSGDEALRIAKAYEGKSLIGQEATKAAFEREAADYRILHLSTHGMADDRVGDFAWLGFAIPGAHDQFEKLYVRDIYNLSLNADLVVLSACQAGLGKLQRGEGIISLSRAFAYAGAKGIITTLWSVDDEKTKDFMITFYLHLQTMPAAEALHQTRLDFLDKRTGEAAHPYFWAGLIGVGDM